MPESQKNPSVWPAYEPETSAERRRISWSIFWIYTTRIGRICFLYLPIPLTLLCMALDYRSHSDLKYLASACAFFVGFALVTVFSVYTLMRTLIALSGSLRLHRKTQNAWVHGSIELISYGILLFYFEFLRPHLNPNVLPLSKQLPVTFLTLPVIAVVIHFTFYAEYFTRAYRSLRQAMAEAQHYSLKSQMQPHFVFNFMNDLSELVPKDAKKARILTQTLSNFYREILQNSKAVTSPLDSEIQIVQHYLELKKLRLGEQLSFHIDIPEDAKKLLIPSLMMQTLVENAVKHGIAKSSQPGSIDFKVRKEYGGLYHFQLTNSGPAYDPKTAFGTGLGNTKTRLHLLAGEQHGFKIQPLPNGTLVEFFIPENFSGKN